MWHYQGKPVHTIEDLPGHENLEGFVYQITNLETGKIYIGKKSLYHTRKTRISKTEKKNTRTRKTFKRVTKESDWQTYYGSSDALRADLQAYGLKSFKRDILELCCTKKYLNYSELAWQIRLDVLKINSYNGNILGRYYHRDMENCKP